jgi:CheY-like chemotaxis protein
MPARRVLLVEDDRDIREGVRALLEEAHYEVVEAVNGSEALKHLRNGAHVGLILLDLMMPVMDGATLLDWLELDESLSAIPVVLMSAHTAATHRRARAVVAKPFDSEDLLAIIEENFVAPGGGPA